MIQLNLSTGSVRQFESKEECFQRMTGKRNVQHAMNDILWDFVRGQGGSIIIDVEGLRRIPPNAVLVPEFDGVRLLRLHARTKEGRIITPPNAGRIVAI